MRLENFYTKDHKEGSFTLDHNAADKILSLSGDISLYSNTTAYGVDFGTNSGKLILGSKALKITANGTGVAYGLVLKDLEFEKEGSAIFPVS